MSYAEALNEALQALGGISRWCLWRMTPDGKKRPINPRTGGGAMANEPSTWADFDTAYEGRGKFGGDGFGFFLGGGYAGIDIDGCIDSDGHLSDMAESIIARMNTYTEISPRGHGVHMLFRVSEGFTLDGKGKQGARNDALGLELYCGAHYLTVTGNILGDLRPIEKRDNEFLEVYREYLLKDKDNVPEKQPVNFSAGQNVSGFAGGKGGETDDELWQYMFDSPRNGASILALYNGDISSYSRIDHEGHEHSDPSAADLALCNYLVHYTDHDAARVDRMFRQSRLMRSKWDEARGTQTYGAITIAKAINDVQRKNDMSTINDTSSVNDTQRMNDTSATKGVNWTYNPDNYNPDSGNNDSGHDGGADAGNGARSGSALRAAGYHSVLGYLENSLSNDIERVKAYHTRKTGYSNLDKHTSLFPGLYVIGSLTGGGKTTLCWEMANNLALRGEAVLYFALEQTELELVSKGLARLTAQEWREQHGADALTKYTCPEALTAINIRKGVKTPALERAIETYKTFAERLFVIECNFDMDAVQMISIVNKYMEQSGVKPVVFVDYLQIVKPAPQAAKMPKREAIDDTVQRFKKLSAESELAIFLISSLNRQNYLTTIDFESFKESGGVEYTADVVWGLQLQAMNAEIFNSDKDLQAKRQFVRQAQNATPRKIELVGLKNRYGKPNMRYYFDYYPAYDLFVPDERDAEDVATEMTLQYAEFQAQNPSSTGSKSKGKKPPEV